LKELTLMQQIAQVFYLQTEPTVKIVMI